MNELNYASLEASKRLVESGIVLETEVYHREVPKCKHCPRGFHEIVPVETMEFYKTGDEIGNDRDIDDVIYYPAPSMAELWRELPESIQASETSWIRLCIEKSGSHTETYYRPCSIKDIRSSLNPCDALAELLLWVKSKGVEPERPKVKESVWHNQIELVLEQIGFEVCEFGPENSDPCEKCGAKNVQLYFQGPTDAGRYYCQDCIIKEYIENMKFDKQMAGFENEFAGGFENADTKI